MTECILFRRVLQRQLKIAFRNLAFTEIEDGVSGMKYREGYTSVSSPQQSLNPVDVNSNLATPGVCGCLTPPPLPYVKLRVWVGNVFKLPTFQIIRLNVGNGNPITSSTFVLIVVVGVVCKINGVPQL